MTKRLPTRSGVAWRALVDARAFERDIRYQQKYYS
jgi:hypothetical protein